MNGSFQSRAYADVPLRSMLFVPGDDERKLSKVSDCGADAVIIDLEDSVSGVRKAVARDTVSTYLARTDRAPGTPALWVRVNPLNTSLALDDLAAVVQYGPAGIVLPKIDGPDDLIALSHHLDALEAAYSLPPRSVQMLPVATETPSAVLRLAELGTRGGLERVYGFTWGAEDLSAALGASTNVDADGRWAATYRLARSMMLLSASAVGVRAIETLYVDIDDVEGLLVDSRAARAEGFTGRIAIHPAQVAAINAAFTPSRQELDHARRVVEAFATAQAGVVALDGKMLDAPHLRQARQTLAVGVRRRET